MIKLTLTSDCINHHVLNRLFCVLGDVLRVTQLQGPVIYRFKDLKSATKSFSQDNKIGEGGFADVYKVTPHL